MPEAQSFVFSAKRAERNGSLLPSDTSEMDAAVRPCTFPSERRKKSLLPNDMREVGAAFRPFTLPNERRKKRILKSALAGAF